MSTFEFLLRTTKSFVVASVIAVVTLPLAAQAGDPAPTCDAPMQMIRFSKPLTHFSQKLSTTEPIMIVAIGSSSTAGAGASSPAATYPSRLQVELNRHFPGHAITVLNRGVGGEEIGDMLKRFDLAVVAVKPDLVLWQFGTNAIIQDQKLGDDAASIRLGLAKIRSVGADVVLIDPQFAPKVIVKPEALQMVELIGTSAKQENVDLLPRFAMMKRWYEFDHLKFDAFVSPDGLHMNDWSYDCLARALGAAIVDAAERPLLSATSVSHLVR